MLAGTEKRIFGPHNPEQGQLWDDDVPEGNNFGTGDADVAFEGTTLYMTYEWPVGIAWKELDVYDQELTTVTASLEVDSDADGLPDSTIQTIPIRPGERVSYPIQNYSCKKFRIKIQMASNHAEVSPMITELIITHRKARTSYSHSSVVP